MVRTTVEMEVTKEILAPRKHAPTSNSHVKDLDTVYPNPGFVTEITTASTIPMRTVAHRSPARHPSLNVAI